HDVFEILHLLGEDASGILEHAHAGGRRLDGQRPEDARQHGDEGSGGKSEHERQWEKRMMASGSRRRPNGSYQPDYDKTVTPRPGAHVDTNGRAAQMIAADTRSSGRSAGE